MSIQPDQVYALLYTPVAFSANRAFLDRVQAIAPQVEIPFLEPNLPAEVEEALDTYVYLPHSPEVPRILARLNRSFPQVGFTNLGSVCGREVLAMLQTVAEEVDSNTNLNHWYKVRSGPHRNLTVQLKAVDAQTETATVAYRLFNEERLLHLPVSNLVSTEQPTNPFIGFQNLIETSPVQKAIIVDGDNALHASMFAYNTTYTRKGQRFVGGAYGFYFTLLRFRQLYPEYEMHVVFDGYDEAKFLANPEYKSKREQHSPVFSTAYRDNQAWIKRFVQAAGFHLYHLANREGDDVIGSLTHTLTTRFGYAEVLIHSKDTDFYQLVSDRVALTVPKATFRDHPEIVNEATAQSKFGVTDLSRINWVRALAGDSTDDIPSVNMYNKRVAHPHTTLQRAHYLPLVNEAADLEALKALLDVQTDKPGSTDPRDYPYRPFVQQGQFDANLNLLTLDRTIFDQHNSLSSFRQEDVDGRALCDEDALRELLAENSFFKELEYADRNFRILRGIW